MAEPLHATFFAFRKREQGGVLTRMTIAFAVCMLVLIAAFIAIFWSSLGPVITWYGEVLSAAAKQDTTAMQNFPSGIFAVVGGLLLWLFPIYILCAAYEAACLKWMIHGETGGFMGLQLSADTFRVWSVYWIWLLLNIAFSFVMSFVMVAIIGVLAVSSGGDPTATTTALPVFYILQYALLVYFAVRFAPAAAASVARRRFSFFAAWTVTKGRFWSLLGSFLLLYLVYAIVSIVMAVVWFTSVIGAHAPDLSSLGSDPQRANQVIMEIMQSYLQSLTEPSGWLLLGVLQIVGMVLVAFFYIAMFGINARAAQAALEEGKIAPATA